MKEAKILGGAEERTHTASSRAEQFDLARRQITLSVFLASASSELPPRRAFVRRWLDTSADEYFCPSRQTATLVSILSGLKSKFGCVQTPGRFAFGADKRRLSPIDYGDRLTGKFLKPFKDEKLPSNLVRPRSRILRIFAATACAFVPGQMSQSAWYHFHQVQGSPAHRTFQCTRTHAANKMHASCRKFLKPGVRLNARWASSNGIRLRAHPRAGPRSIMAKGFWNR